MGFLDDAKKKLTKAVDQHGDKIAQGIDKAAQAADKKTGGKYSSQITSGAAKVKEGLDGLDGRKDDIRRPGTHPTTGPVDPTSDPKPPTAGPADGPAPRT